MDLDLKVEKKNATSGYLRKQCHQLSGKCVRHLSSFSHNDFDLFLTFAPSWQNAKLIGLFLCSRVEKRSPTIYIGGGQDFLSEIGLFRKLPGTELFASRVKSGSSIELGENVQLRSIVRSGDGK